MTDVVGQVCFVEDAIDGALMARIVADLELGLTATMLRCDRFRDLRWGPKALERLASTPRFDYAAVTDSGDNEFSVNRMGGHMQQVIWRPATPGVLAEGIESVTRYPGFNAAYLGDATDAQWQSETAVGNYEAAGRPHDHLAKREGGLLPWETESIDISEHWGRSIVVDGLWLWAASTMWFGTGAFKLLDREGLRSLPVGEVTGRDDGVIRVELFPLDWFDTNLAEVRERQRTFWEWMGLADLEERRGEIDAAASDPEVEIETGTFEHGGVRRITEWLDDSRRPAPRSQATRFHRAEFSLDGEVVWREDSRAS
jgi:hypothetical protein